MDGVILQSGAQKAVERRMIFAAGSVVEMFDGLELGWTAEDVLTYMRGTPGWQALERQGADGKAFGMALSIAALCVERERERNGA